MTKLTFFTATGESFFLELPADMSIADIKTLLEGDAQVPPSEQVWVVDGKEVVETDKTLEQLSWPEEVVVSFSRRGQHSQPPQQQQRQPQPSGSGQPQFSRAQMDHIRQQAEQYELMDRLEADPYDVESQTKIAEILRQQSVMESFESAMEHSPESFAQVTMLYIDTEVNGHKVKAFVDSGAQSTIISPDCAEQCNLMRLLDTRFQGEARGVGTAKILGRIHTAQIKLGDVHLPVSLTVMEGKDVDLLFGLDMLKRHQACIDLSKGGGVLRIQGREVPFLSEHELPAKAKRETWVDDESADAPGAKKVKVTPANPDLPGGVSAEEAKNAAAKGVVASFPGGGNTLSTPAAATSSSAPQSSAPASSAPAPSSQQQPSSKWPEQSIQTLVGLGVSKEQAISYLDMTNGNVDHAASLLF